jgi:hypothetical protein
VVGQHHVVVAALVQVQLAALDQVVGELADVLRHRVARVEEVPGAGQGVQEAVGDAPGMAALAEDDALDLELDGGLADAQRDPAHVLVGADEHAEVGRLGGVLLSVQDTPASWNTLP